MNFPDAMARYWGEIERNLYAAEQLCNQNNPRLDKKICADCDFHKKNPEILCPVMEIRTILGEHRPPGLCPHQGMDNGCHFGAPCQFQRIDYSVPVGISCGRESAALAVAEAAEQEQAGDHP